MNSVIPISVVRTRTTNTLLWWSATMTVQQSNMTLPDGLLGGFAILLVAKAMSLSTIYGGGLFATCL